MENKTVAEKLKENRPTLKKKVQYLENDMVRRSTYSRRTKSLVVASMELEIQTGCHVDMRILPTWPKGKTHMYHSISPVQEKEDQPPTVNEETPSEPLRTVSVNKSVNPSSCRICGQSADLSFWLGCSYTNPKSKRQDCRYWVHQKCIGLFYKKESDLQRVPFYCPKHGM